MLIAGRLVLAVAVFAFIHQDRLYIKLGIFFMSTLRTLTTAEFEQQVLQSDLPVVVDFGPHGARRAGRLLPSLRIWRPSSRDS